MAIVINGQTGIDAGHLPISNAGNTEVEGTLTAQGQNVSPFSGFKNYIINGNFDVWQRGTAFNNVFDQSYTADRWVHTRDGSGANVNIFKREWEAGSPETGVGSTEGSIFEFAQTVAGSGCTYNTINQRIEGVQWSSQKTLTLSFNCEFVTSADVLPRIVVRQNFGSGGSGVINTVIATNISVNATTDWDKKSFTFTLPNITGKTIGTSPHVEIILFLPVNKVFQFRLNAVQLEEGSVATPFENRPYGLEFSLCQRYYEVGRCIQQLGIGTTIGVALTGQVFFKTSKRIVPTVTYLDFSGAQNKVTLLNNSGAETNGVSVIAGNQTNNDMRLTASTTNTTQNGIGFNYTASAEL